jgi:heptosyltransferase-2
VLEGARRILVVRLDEIGDVVMTTPLLRELRRNAPRAWITLVVKPGIVNLVELCPHVDEVLSMDPEGAALLRPALRHGRALRLALRRLRPRGFDLAILPRWDVDGCHGVFLQYLSGAGRRVGYSESVSPIKRRLNRGYDRYLTDALAGGGVVHEVERGLDILRFLGGEVSVSAQELWTSKEDDRVAADLLARAPGFPGRAIVGLCPGAGARKRRLPATLLQDLLTAMRGNRGVTFALLGAPGDERLVGDHPWAIGGSWINLAGRTTLRQAAAVLRECRVVIGADAGLVHVAAAVGTPAIVVSCHPAGGSPASANSPRRFRPWGAGSIVLQPEEPAAGCRDECLADEPHCIAGVEAGVVLHALHRFLGRRVPSGVPALSGAGR